MDVIQKKINLKNEFPEAVGSCNPRRKRATRQCQVGIRRQHPSDVQYLAGKADRGYVDCKIRKSARRVAKTGPKNAARWRIVVSSSTFPRQH
jgi:hypothetical protein